MPRRTSGPVTFVISSPDLAKLYQDLKAVEGNLRVELRRGIRKAAQPIADKAKQNASWSSRIPGAIGIKVSFAAKSAGVQLAVDPKKAPHARPYEHGDRPGQFRHPVYADPAKPRQAWTWVPQNARPFFLPAAREGAEQARAAIAEVLDTVARKAGFK